MIDYSKKTTYKDRFIKNGERLFKTQVKNGFDGHYVTIDEIHEDIPMVIRTHTNPMNEGLLDNKAIFLSNSGNFFHIGNLIRDEKTNKEFIAVTKPCDNGIYSTYKIRPLTEQVKFIIDYKEIIIGGILASGLLYKDGAYVNQTNVFEDNTMKAVIVQFNPITDKLKLFDNIIVDDKHYKICKINNETLRDEDDCGVLQLVVFAIPRCELNKLDVLTNTKENFEGILKYARVKDKKLNSVSRELLCNYQTVNTGDYIEYTYDCDENGTMKTEVYMVYNVPTMYDGYDISLVYRCMNNFKILDNKGEIISIPYYFEDNRTRIDKTTDTDFLKDFNSSYMIVMQDNEVTKKFVDRKITRIILKGVAYEITGVSNLDEGLIWLGLELDEINPANDKFDVADYVQQYNFIKNNNHSLVDTFISGETSIFKGISWEYELQSPAPIYVNQWTTNSPFIEIISQENNKCTLKVSDKYDMGSIVILKASSINNVEYTKEIILE